MATEIRPDLERLTTRRYLAMIAQGIIPHDARVELLDGRLVEQMTKYPPHNYSVGELAGILRHLLSPDWVVREEKPVLLGKFWRPEPDIAVVRGPNATYRTHDPARTEIAILIEVSDSSYSTDRGEKWRAYAAARIPLYWIVNLGQSRVEVYREPAGKGRTASYRQADIYGIDAELPLVIDGQVVGRVIVNDLLP